MIQIVDIIAPSDQLDSAARKDSFAVMIECQRDWSTVRRLVCSERALPIQYMRVSEALGGPALSLRCRFAINLDYQ